MGRVNIRWSILVAVAALAGCGGGSGTDHDAAPPSVTETVNVVQPGAPGQPTRKLTAKEIAKIPATTHTAADISFMQGMIHHHAQALRMTSLIPKRTTNRDIRLLGKRIDVSQEAEIAVMRRWLIARGEPAPQAHRVHGHAHGIGQRLMPGMLSQADMDRLASARGKAFDRLFLRSMIRHHQGALTMVAELYAANGGGESEVDAFARGVDADQEIEIGRMQELLAELR